MKTLRDGFDKTLPGGHNKTAVDTSPSIVIFTVPPNGRGIRGQADKWKSFKYHCLLELNISVYPSVKNYKRTVSVGVHGL